MMAQYFSLREDAGDCLLFYRMGDFFELFFDDAIAAAETLDIALTTRGEHQGQPVPMCGVPVHSAEGYLARLIRGGHKVAIAEQIETPAEARARGGSKALVARGIVRVVTAGTLTEDALLETRSANLLLAVHPSGEHAGLACCDISTGRFELCSVPIAALPHEISRLNPSEVIMPEGSETDIPNASHRSGETFVSAAAERRLQDQFGSELGDTRFDLLELSAAAGLFAYLDHVGKGAAIFLKPPVRWQSGYSMAIDESTRASLEILAGSEGTRKGSLMACVDRTVTGAGARLLAEDLSAPLCTPELISDRLDLVSLFLRNSVCRSELRAELRKVPDIGRALGRLVAGRGTPRDLGQVRDGLAAGRSVFQLLKDVDAPPLLLELLPRLDCHAALLEHLSRALVESPTTERQSGGYVAAGFDEELDTLREASGNARKAIAALESRYRTETGVQALKIKHNGVLGYFIEVPPRHADGLMAAESPFAHRQTLANAVRFNAPELHEEAGRIIEAGSLALAREDSHFETMVNMAVEARQSIARTADALARLDVASALAERAIEDKWCRPVVDDSLAFAIEAGRHPAVEAALRHQRKQFVANDCNLEELSRLWLISGPNMGGKSTFLRQNAIITILAQAGCYVPARSAHIGTVDKMFSRVGASDNLARGQSTFMVEMVETAAILNQATERSFVILDEVGRGTSTYDGLALAWAVVEAMHEVNKSRCLFATHYHELTRLAETLDSLTLHHVKAREWKGDLVLLHEVADGPADRSYGLSVARLAGVPQLVIQRARSVLDKLEAGKNATGGLAAGLDDLPLFANLAEAEEKTDPLRDAIASLDVDALSPREALEHLYELRKLAGD